MKLRGILICLLGLLTSCSLAPKPLLLQQRYCQAKKDVHKLFAPQARMDSHIDFSEALARAIKYNLDYRIKLVNIALQSNQLELAVFSMFPSLTATGSLYNRNNRFASFGVTTSGQVTDVLTSTPETLKTARVAMSWNVLDFGLGWVKAKQQSNRILISREETRKQLQQLAQDVRIAYWKAYSAQRLMKDVHEFERYLKQAKRNVEAAMGDRTVPKEALLNYQQALLQSDRNLIQLTYKLDKALLDLKHLLSIPLDQPLILSRPPYALTHVQDLRDLDFAKLDSLALVLRPELLGQSYQKRIARLGISTVVLQALPGITLNKGWNYNSNMFLINTTWLDRSIDLSWNLLNVFSLPSSYKVAKSQVVYEKLKLMALTLTILTENRYAFVHYTNAAKEFMVTHKLSQNAGAFYELARNRNRAALASFQEVILAKMHAITSRMDEDLVLADVSTALGELYLSAGFDLLPMNVLYEPLPITIARVRRSLANQSLLGFKQYVNDKYEKIFGKPHFYTLQLYGSFNRDYIYQLKSWLNIGLVHVYLVVYHNRPWYILTYGKFGTVREAELAYHCLTPGALRLKPWIRKIYFVPPN